MNDMRKSNYEWYDMRKSNYEWYEKIKLWMIWECKNYEINIFEPEVYGIPEFKFFCSEVYEIFEFKILCPSSVVSIVVVVLRPASVPSVRRRRPSSSSSVRPSVPSVRRRRPSSSRCESKAACKFSKKHQNMSPTASGPWNSDRARSGDFSSRPEIAVRVEKVSFVAETLLL